MSLTRFGNLFILSELFGTVLDRKVVDQVLIIVERSHGVEFVLDNIVAIG